MRALQHLCSTYILSNIENKLTRCLSRDTLEDVVHERVEDGHCLVGDTRVRVHLLQHYTDVSQLCLIKDPTPSNWSGASGLPL